MRLAFAAALGTGGALAALAIHAQRLQERRVAALERDLARLVTENRLRAPGAPPRREDPQDLATWAAEIDRLVQESYGELLRLSLSEAQIRSVVQSLEARVATGAAIDLSDPVVRAELKKVVDGVVSEHLYDKGFILKRKTLSLDEVAERVGLAPDQREALARVFSDAREAILDLARDHQQTTGRDLLADLFRLENLPWASPEREALSWRLLATDISPDRTLHAWLVEQERLIQTRMDALLTPEQTARYRFLGLVPWDLVGIALQSPGGGEDR